MADYYPLLAKAVAGLPNSTAETRHAIYERARNALFGQLRTLDPPVPEEAIEREAQALERAVAQLETELTSLSGTESGALPAGTEFAGSGAPAATVPALEPNTAPQPKPTSQNKGAAGRAFAKVTAPAARTPRPPASPLKVRRDSSGASPAAPSLEAPQPGKASNHKGPASRSGPTPAAPSISKPFATQDEFQVPEAGIAPYGRAAFSGPDVHPAGEGASGPEAPVLNAPSFETFAPEAPGTGPESYEPPARTRLEAQHPFAPRPEGDTGAVKRVGIVVGIVGLVVALVAIAAYKLRDRPEDLVRLQPSSPAVQGEAGSGGKIVDRIEAGGATPGAPPAGTGVPSTTAERNDGAKSGSGPANPPLPVAQRAALLMEAPEEQSKVKTLLGRVVWRVDNVSNGPDEPLSMAVRAEVDVPEEGLQASIIIEKNFDSTLPASHTIKLRFSARPGSPLADIKQVSVSLRREDSPTGEALKGISVPVTQNSFLVGLSRGDGEASNLDLLHSREWFDIPIVLANGHIAKLTFEKGPSGRSALDDALASWQAQ
ncbi:MAG TPA: hypothetical protein VMU78_00035 [Methylocella sp.]|nr:hypothetical protein [Methylocella sp.]